MIVETLSTHLRSMMCIAAYYDSSTAHQSLIDNDMKCLAVYLSVFPLIHVYMSVCVCVLQHTMRAAQSIICSRCPLLKPDSNR